MPFLTLILAIFSVVNKKDYSGIENKPSTRKQSTVGESSKSWHYIGTSYGVKTYTMVAKGFGTAVRGVGDIPMHISKVFSVFTNTSLSSDWIDMLQVMQVQSLDAKDIENPMTSLVYQKYDLPFPLTDRDFVLRRDIKFDSKSRKISVDHFSIDDYRFPVKKDLIRAETLFAKWTFRSEQNHNTYSTNVTVETVADLKGDLPVFFGDYLQRSWPSKTIDALRHLVDKYANLKDQTALDLHPEFRRLNDW